MLTIQKKAEYLGHKGCVYAIATLPDFQAFLTGGDDGWLVQWQLGQPELGGTALMQIPNAIYCITNLGNHLIALAGFGGIVYVLDTASKKLRFQVKCQSGAIYQLIAHGQTLWVLGAKGLLQILDLETGTIVSQQQLGEHNLRDSQKQATQIWIASSSGAVYCLNTETYAIENTWHAHNNGTMCLLLDSTKQQLLTGGHDAQLRRWNITQPNVANQEVAAHMYTINDLLQIPDQSILVSASRDKTLKFWHSNTLDLLNVLDFQRHFAHTHSVNALAYLDHTLLSVSDDKRIIAWEISS
jgi:WD40 repeat protein